MKIKLLSAVGLALLAASFTFGNSFACSDAPKMTASVVPIAASDPNTSKGLDERLCAIYIDALDTCFTNARDAELGPSSLATSEIEVVEAAPTPTIRFVDAIKVDVTQTVTIAIAGEDVADNEVTGSISERPSAESSTVLDAQVTALDDTN